MVNPTPSQSSVRRVLEQHRLFTTLTEDDLIRLLSVSRFVRVDRGEVIWFGHQRPDFFGVVSVGFVKMARSSGNNHDVTVEIMGPGHIFGLNGAIAETGCPLTASAVTELVYVRVPIREFLDVYQGNIQLRDAHTKMVVRRLHDKVEIMAKLTNGRVEERLAAILLILADSYGKRTEQGVAIEVPLTRQEIGELAATTTETTIRVLSKWQKMGVVCSESRTITIMDEQQLEAIFR